MNSNIKKIFEVCKENNNKYTFYSEGVHYQKYFYTYIQLLSKNKKKIIYLSSEKKDKINLECVENIYIGNGILRYLVFLFVKSKLFFLTTTDLDNNILKKNSNIKNYIYVFHAAQSTHKVYTKNAFNNYHSILCVGNYHNHEIKKTENLYNLSKKKLINSGYFYFDYLLQYGNFNITENYILIAPSWNYNKNNFLNIECEKLIELLINKNYKIIFRPHPEHFKRSKLVLDKIYSKFKKFSNFKVDLDKDNISSLEKSYTLITDNSGIAIEYMLIFQKPVVYFDQFSKIHNDNYVNLKIEAFEDKVKDEFGYSINQTNLENFEQEIKKANDNLIKKKPLIRNFIKSNFYNFGNTSEYIFKYFSNED